MRFRESTAWVFLFLMPAEDFLTAQKPTYEELERRLQELEKTTGGCIGAKEPSLRETDFPELIIDSLPGIFYFFNDTGKFLRWNKNFEKVYGA